MAGDTLIGGSGRDSLTGRGGDDRIHAADGQADAVIDWGPGVGDAARIDLGVDPLPTGCEIIVSG